MRGTGAGFEFYLTDSEKGEEEQETIAYLTDFEIANAKAHGTRQDISALVENGARPARAQSGGSSHVENGAPIRGRTNACRERKRIKYSFKCLV